MSMSGITGNGRLNADQFYEVEENEFLLIRTLVLRDDKSLDEVETNSNGRFQLL